MFLVTIDAFYWCQSTAFNDVVTIEIFKLTKRYSLYEDDINKGTVMFECPQYEKPGTARRSPCLKGSNIKETHEAEREPFQCSQCSFESNNRHTLRKHRQAPHEHKKIKHNKI